MHTCGSNASLDIIHLINSHCKIKARVWWLDAETAQANAQASILTPGYVREQELRPAI